MYHETVHDYCQGNCEKNNCQKSMNKQACLLTSGGGKMRFRLMEEQRFALDLVGHIGIGWKKRHSRGDFLSCWGKC